MLANERGIALPLALVVVLALASLGLGLAAVGSVEPQISRNVSEGTQARYAAEAGVEWTYRTQLAGVLDWSGVLTGATLTEGRTLVTDMTIPGMDPGRPTFTVNVRNDARPAGAGYPADSSYTGVALDTGGATSDTNGRVIVTSTGRAGRGNRTVQVVARRITMPPLVAALAFPGNEAETRFSGSSFEVDGNDWTYNPGSGTAIQTNSCPRVFGISVSSTLGNPPGSNEQVVQNSLAANQKSDVKGKSEIDGSNTTGNATIAQEPTLTPQVIADFVAAAKQAADISLFSPSPGGLSYSNIGASCASDIGSPTCWGTEQNPKIVYVKGSPDPTSMFTALSLSGGTVGYGILIVEDGDVKISGNFNWNGLILVTGSYVGVGFMGGGNQAVYGTVISNETGADPSFNEGVLVGNAKLRYSCHALDVARGINRLVTLNWTELSN